MEWSGALEGPGVAWWSSVVTGRAALVEDQLTPCLTASLPTTLMPISSPLISHPQLSQHVCVCDWWPEGRKVEACCASDISSPAPPCSQPQPLPIVPSPAGRHSAQPHYSLPPLSALLCPHPAPAFSGWEEYSLWGMGRKEGEHQWNSSWRAGEKGQAGG